MLRLGLIKKFIGDVEKALASNRLLSAFEDTMETVLDNIPSTSWFEAAPFGNRGQCCLKSELPVFPKSPVIIGLYIGRNWLSLLRLIRWVLWHVRFGEPYQLPSGTVEKWTARQCVVFMRAHEDFETSYIADDGSRRDKLLPQMRREIKAGFANRTLKLDDASKFKAILHVADCLHALAGAVSVRDVDNDAVTHADRCSKCFLDAYVGFESAWPTKKDDDPLWARRTNFGQCLGLAAQLRDHGPWHYAHNDDLGFERMVSSPLG